MKIRIIISVNDYGEKMKSKILHVQDYRSISFNFVRCQVNIQTIIFYKQRVEIRRYYKHSICETLYLPHWCEPLFMLSAVNSVPGKRKNLVLHSLQQILAAKSIIENFVSKSGNDLFLHETREFLEHLKFFSSP